MTDRPPVVIITGRHRPHELLLLGVSLLLGLAYLAGSPSPGSIVATWPAWGIRVWAALLFISGAIGLVGCLWRGRNTALALGLEAGALLVGAGALLLYVVAAATFGGWRAMFAAAVVFAWMLANLWRAEQIRRDLSALPTSQG